MSGDTTTPFERALNPVPYVASKPHKPEMRIDRLHYELEASRAQVAELAQALREICGTWEEPANAPGPSLDSLIQTARALLTRLGGE